MNYIDLFRQNVEKTPDKPAIVDFNGERTLTYKEVDVLSSKVANKLHNLGIHKAEPVIINIDRRSEYIISFIGILKMGGVTISVISDYPKERIEYIKNDSNTRLVITERFFNDIDTYDEFVDLASDTDPAILNYTSGTTGRPKGILQSTADFYRGVTRMFDSYTWVNEIRHASTVPLSFAANAFDVYLILAIGGTLYITPDEVRKSNINLAEFIRKNNITTAYITPSLLKMYNNTSTSLKLVITAGERVSNCYSNDYRIISAYGMSEEYIVTTFLVDRKYENTPIGKAVKGIEILILDENGNEVKKGEKGEICAKGDFDTIYYKDTEKTNNTFIKTSDNKTLIHSGDLGYIDENGNVIYLTRKDWMVKINGQRVETFEIENVIRENENIKDAIVHFFSDKDGQNYLVAYYVVNNKDNSIESKLRKELSKKLPSYMMPRFFEELKEIPKNRNGKVDRSVLTPPDKRNYKAEYEPPRNKLEEKMCLAMGEVLDAGRVGINDNFFMLGGDSIKTIKLLSLLNIDGLTREKVLIGKTVKEIVKLIDKKENVLVHDHSKSNEYPLTSAQRGVYFECEANKESTMYNIAFLGRLPSKIDVDLFIESIEKVVKVHPAFNVTFDVINGEPKMSINEFKPVIVKKNINSIEDECNKFVRPFDLKMGPLYRFEIWKDTKHTYFAYDIHHLIFDGTSTNIFLTEILKTYKGEDINEEEFNIFDVSLSEINKNENLKYKKAQKFFDDKLSNTDIDSVIVQDIIDENAKKGIDSVSIDIADHINNSTIENFVNKNGITENTLFLSAFAYTLAKFNGTKEALFCTVNNGRHTTSLSRSIGMFVKTLPMYYDFNNKNRRVKDYLTYSQDYIFNTINYDLIDMSELVHKYNLNTSIQFVYQGSMLTSVNYQNITIVNKEMELKDLAGSLQMMVHKTFNSYKAVVHFDTSLYSKKLITSFTKMYFKVVEELLTKEYLKDVEFVSSETKAIIDKFNDTESFYNKDITVIDKFKRQVKLNPDVECVVYGSHKYTYKQVDEITDKLAKYLIKLGVKKETFTGILINRNEYMTIASLAVLKAGGAYMPLDPSYPKERLNFMMKDSSAIVLVCEKELSSIIDDDINCKRFYIEDIDNLVNEDIDLNNYLPQVKDAFVLLYTSGTTGTPKGVVYEHANVMCLAEWMADFFRYDVNSKRAVYASYGFDANVFDTYGILISGASLHIIPEEMRLDLIAIQKYFNENNITDCVMTTQVGRAFALMEGTKTLKELSVAGEALTPLTPLKDYKLYNLYGPTEGTVLVTAFEVDKKYTNVPIGKPISNVKIYVVDDLNRLLPQGAIGELVIAGPHVTRGYLNNIEKTNAVYGTSDFSSDENYKRIYHTGDVVRYRPSGDIQFIGRRDNQVKIRGFRVELTEIEEVIRRYSNIKDATVVAFENDKKEKYLAAYVVSNEKINDKDLKDFIKSEKPSYMVPQCIMQIDKIPLNQNQKVNKKALPVPEFKLDDIVLPKNDNQKKIYDIVVSIIGHDNFGIDSDLFDIGLTSIGNVKLNYELAEKFNKALKTSDIVNNPTVSKLEKLLVGKQESISYEILKEYPITKNQDGIFVECVSNPDSTIYNIPTLFKVENSTTEKLKEAIIKVVDNHPYIKMKLHMDKNNDIQAIRNDESEVNVEVIKIDFLPDIKDLVKPFTLLDSPLYRISIYDTVNGIYLFVDMHHIIADGSSEKILYDDIKKCLDGIEITKESYTAYELALDEKKLRDSINYTKAKDYYTSLLSSVEDNSLPPKTLDASTIGSSQIVKELSIDVDIIKEYCKANNYTGNAFFNAVFSFELSSFIHSEQVVYTTIHNGRNDSRLINSIGMLVKTIPVYVDIKDNYSSSYLINTIQKQLVNNMNNDIYSFSEISNAFGIKSDILFVYQGDDYSFDSLNNKYLKFESSFEVGAKAPLSFELIKENNKYVVKFDYKTDVYNKDFVNSFIDAFETATNNFIKTEYLRDISLVSDKTREFINKTNNTDTSIKRITIDKLFEEMANNYGDKIAIISNHQKITYKELNEKVNKLANALISKGIKKEDIVGVVVNRGIEAIIAELGVVKAGGAFLPMPPEYPSDRIDYCLLDSESKYVIVTNKIKDERKDIFNDRKLYEALTIEELLNFDNDQNPNVDISLNNLVYCIYTSGSTGKPKGVMIEHRGLTNFVQTYDGLVWTSLGVSGNIMGISSISFDMSIYDIYGTILNGKTFVMPNEEEIHDPLALANLIKENNVEAMACTPSFITNMIDIDEFAESFKNFKAITLGAEALNFSIVNKCKKIAPNITICNGYGPTETTIGSSAQKVLDGKPITIGGPSGNIKYYAIDRFGNILPPYAQGELIICGEIVSRGYIKLPEKNKLSFYTIDNLPAYHSGDIVRLLNNGEYEFFGRRDNQVKLRGFRVELDEIEKTICSYQGIKQSKVIVRNNGKEDYLAAFFVADHEIDLDELKVYLKDKLTYYMVPSAMKQLDEMPLNASGKVDKNKLPEITIVKKERSKKHSKKNNIVNELCELFKTILNVDEFFEDDDFFECGGTSLSASKLTMALMAKGIKIQYQDVFDNPTPIMLAELISDMTSDKDEIEYVEEETESEFADVLKNNILANAEKLKRKELGNTFLTGATGFLGMHVLRELYLNEKGHIYCLIRKGKYKSPKDRLTRLVAYYFDDTYEEAIDRITFIDADVTSDKLIELTKDYEIDTIINCAAIVKHYAADDSIENVNVKGVEKLIELAKEKSARLIQISTTSIPGVHVDLTYKRGVKMHENEFFMIDSMDNKYILSKYHAEQKMYEAIRSGLDGKVIRVGNLMGRYEDGEFQFNLTTNAFLNALRGFATLGVAPIGHSTDPMGFSPVDLVARAVVLLAGTNKEFTAFNADNRYGFDEYRLIDACNRCGVKINRILDEEYYKIYFDAMKNEKINARLQGLVTNDRPDLHVVETDNKFTANILYRMNFEWPFASDQYLDKTINSIKSLGFFDYDDEEIG